MNPPRIPLCPLSDIPNIDGYSLTLHDRCGAKWKAVVFKPPGFHAHVGLDGRIYIPNELSRRGFLGWEEIPEDGQPKA